MDPTQPQAPQIDPATGRPMVGQPRQASPGVGGAISDAIAALAQALGPKAITQHPQQVEGQVNAQSLGDSF